MPEPVDPVPRPEALPLSIVYQDRDLIVVDKPAGMVVHPAAGHASGTLVNALLHHVDDLSGIGGEKRPGIVHRLDRGTSGLMVVAKHDSAHEELARQFADREVEKEYIALTWGEVMAGRRIDAPIGRDPSNRKKMASASARVRRSREAVTRIVRAEHFGRVLTLAGVAIHTGRTHQIRVHLSAHRPSNRRRFAVRRCPSACSRRRSCHHAPRSAVPPCRAAGVHASRRRDGAWSSRASCPTICSAYWTSSASRSTPRCTSRDETLGNRWSATASAERRMTVHTVFRGRVFSVEAGNLTFPNGRDHDVAIVRHAPSVVLIPVDDDGRVVLVRQYRAPIDRMTWEFPAGSLDAGESADAAARRECEEEIGRVPERLERLGAWYPTPWLW